MIHHWPFLRNDAYLKKINISRFVYQSFEVLLKWKVKLNDKVYYAERGNKITVKTRVHKGIHKNSPEKGGHIQH